MLSKCSALGLCFVLAFAWVPCSEAGVSSKPVGESQDIGVSTELNPGTIVVATRQEAPRGIEMPGGSVGNFKEQTEVRLAALSYEPPGLYKTSDLPKILSDSDVSRYRDIFQLQEEGLWSEADKLIGELADDILLGHVRFQRYMHPTAYRSKFMELATWLEDYGDQPGSHRIYRLAMKRKPGESSSPVEPDRRYLHGVGAGTPSSAPILPRRSLGEEQRAAVSDLEAKIAVLIGRGMPTRAAELLEQAVAHSWMTEAEIDRLQANISRGFYSYGKNERALSLADSAAQRSRYYVPDAYWIAGLASWRLGEVAYAVQAFQNVAANESGSEALRAAGAFWAARAHEALGNKYLAESYFGRAATLPYTLYGLLALRVLGEVPPFYWEPISLYSYDLEGLIGSGHVKRAVALKQIGQDRLAEQELRVYFPQAPEGVRSALLRLSVALDLPALQIRIAGVLAGGDRSSFQSALYPAPKWNTGTLNVSVDQPLLFALIRQESIFDERARSRRGARGLMQLMPRTATFIGGGYRYHSNRARADKLFDPQLNLELGQSYMQHLLSDDQFEGNLLLALAAYNTGPSKVRKWIKHVDFRSDPLLFLETVPSPETRRFLSRVLTNFAIYGHRFGRDWGHFDALAAGEWPKYVDGRPDTGVRRVARD
ncbi:MAG: lytic transglycosylase domain-containing protein [Pseudomonadota bacterium]|nr:lytic transglycosylase domain-containing protein [Pseudomonadota bacterium]